MYFLSIATAVIIVAVAAVDSAVASDIDVAVVAFIDAYVVVDNFVDVVSIADGSSIAVVAAIVAIFVAVVTPVDVEYAITSISSVVDVAPAPDLDG